MDRVPLLSLIIPCYNEKANLPRFFESVTAIFDEAGFPYELIFIDDGSSDGTFEVLRGFAEDSAGVHVIRFSRNFGKEAGLYAGLQEARGDHVGFIDADMQQDPRVMYEMLEYLRRHREVDCVAAYQERRHESIPMRLLKKGFYRSFNTGGDVRLPPDMSDFRVFRRSVAEALLSMPEYFRFAKGMFAWIGFSTYAFPYEPADRFAGESKWSFWKLLRYALQGIVSFTTWPLKIAIWMGALIAVAAIVYLVMVLVEFATVGSSVAGYPTLVCLILLLGGLQLIVLGFIGEYLSRTYIEGKRRPIYIAKTRSSSSCGERNGDAAASSQGGIHER